MCMNESACKLLEKFGYLLVSCDEKGIRIPLPSAASGTLRKKTLKPFHPTQYQLRYDSFTTIHMHAIFGNFSPLVLACYHFFILAIFRTNCHQVYQIQQEASFLMKHG